MLLLLACATSTPSHAATAGFWEHWGDGKAEVSSYDLVQPRYDALHAGTAVLIFVTEDFSWSERVKADPGAHPASDLRPVLKLNETRDFTTGIYTYHTMTSSFSRVEGGDGMAALDPIKLTFSAQEWCGMVYDELVMGPGTLHEMGHTYFDSDTRAPTQARVPKDVVYGDTIAVLLRGLEGEWVARGASREVPWMPSRMDQRFAHVAPAVGKATVSRAATTTSQTTPAGTFTVDRYDVAVAGGPTQTWFVEEAWPHHIIAWESSTGERGTLRGTDRLPYWGMHAPEDVAARARVGL